VSRVSVNGECEGDERNGKEDKKYGKEKALET
jgi:hypothetical protein